ncbi:MAG: hypothetical protein HFG47_02815 [Lachnospiraceae bacterium]|nr:hypothetical protein [Lachnospiraceae bacterium]
MKRSYLIAAAVCLALGLGACSRNSGQDAGAGESSAVAESQSEEKETPSAKAADQVGKETGESETKTEEATTEEAKEQAITGRVEGIEKEVVTINGQDGLEYQIDLSAAETRSSLEIGEGDEIQVVFLDGKEKVKKAQSYEIISSVALEGDLDPVIAGVIKEVSGSVLTIETAGGKTHKFSTEIAQTVTGEKGLASGENVEVTYLGKLDEEIAIRVITEEGSGDVDATYSAISGTLLAASDQAVVIQAANGRQFTFAVGENIDAMDYEIGELVEVTYEGSLTKENAVAEGIDYQ